MSRLVATSTMITVLVRRWMLGGMFVLDCTCCEFFHDWFPMLDLFVKLLSIWSVVVVSPVPLGCFLKADNEWLV